MKYDIEAFDRASEKSEQKSYAFLLQSIRDPLDRERLRSNRNRIVEKNKQGAEKPQPAAAAQGDKPNPRRKNSRGRSRERSQSAKGEKICFKFKDGKCDKDDKCPYKHGKDPKPRSNTPKNGKKGNGKGRSPSKTKLSKEEMAKIPCAYFQQGNCHRGDKRFYKHEKAAPTTKDAKRTNSPAPRKKASAKAAPCLLEKYACIAKGRKGLPKATKAMKDQSHRVVVFSSKVETIKFPAVGEQRKLVYKPRLCEKRYPKTEMVPKSDPLDAHRAQVVARQLQEVVSLFGSDQQLRCRFRMLKTAEATNRRLSETPICLATASGSTRADEVADVTVDALHRPFSSYILDETPAVLSVGVRCMERGYSFVWPADGTPYFIRPDHYVIQLNVDGTVPVIDPTCRVISRKEFKSDCHLLRLFAMPSAAARDPAEAEEDGVDEGQSADEEAEYTRSRKTADLEKEAKSAAHQFCHFPKNPVCKVCQKARMMAPPAKKRGGQKRLDTRHFAEHLIADHTVVKTNVEEGIKGETVALVKKDVHTQFRHAYPSQSKSGDSCVTAFNDFLSHKDEVGAVYTDNSRKLIAAIGEMRFHHQTSTEYVDSSESFVERGVRHAGGDSDKPCPIRFAIAHVAIGNAAFLRSRKR
eukprot:s114_g12.t1